MKLKIFCLLAAVCVAPLRAQNKQVYDLRRCIETAIENNIDIQLSELNVENADISYRQSLLNMAPNLSANGGQFYQSGRSIDRFSNQFVQKTVGNSSAQLQSNWLLYAGGSIRNTIKQRKKTLEAAHLDYQQVQQNIALNVVLTYLQCQQNKESWGAQQSNTQNAVRETKRIEKLYKAGATNQGALLAAQAQEAQATSLEVQSKNQYLNSILSLKNLMRLDHTEMLQLADMTTAVPEYVEFPLEVNELIDSALSHRPDYQASRKRSESMLYALKAAKGALQPTLSVGANLSTVYSDNAIEITGAQISGTQPIGFVQGSGDIVEAPTFDYSTQTIGFGTQMRDNFGQSFGATLSVPIFNRLQTQTNIAQSRLALIQSKWNQKQIKQAVINDVVNAQHTFNSAATNYQALRSNYEAQSKNLDFVQKQFNLGQVSFYEVQQTKNQERQAYQQMLSAKYETALRDIILQFIAHGDIKRID